MKAWVLHGANNLSLEEVPRPKPKAGEVILAVKALGICGSDIPRIYRTGAHVHPLIPGHEFSGVVTETGENVNPGWLHKRVGVFPLIPCGICDSCRKQQYEMCRSYGYLGSRQDGSFAEYVAIPVTNLVELPDNVSFEEAAMLEPMAVAVHAMRRLSPKQDEIVAVCGLGTIGLLLTMFLFNAGVRNVFVIGNKPFQREAAVRLGISSENFCDTREQNVAAWLAECTGSKGVDVFFECVGKKETLAYAINGTAPGGRICVVGNPASDMTLERDVYWRILRNQLTLRGSWNSSFVHSATDDWHYVLNQLTSGCIQPATLITHRFSLEQMKCGLDIMREKKQEYIKIMGINM